MGQELAGRGAQRTPLCCSLLLSQAAGSPSPGMTPKELRSQVEASKEVLNLKPWRRSQGQVERGNSTSEPPSAPSIVQPLPLSRSVSPTGPGRGSQARRGRL